MNLQGGRLQNQCHMDECSRGCTILYRITPHLYTCITRTGGALADEVEQELLELVRAPRVYCQFAASVQIMRGHADDGPQCPALSVSSRIFGKSCAANSRVFRLMRLRTQKGARRCRRCSRRGCRQESGSARSRRCALKFREQPCEHGRVRRYAPLAHVLALLPHRHTGWVSSTTTCASLRERRMSAITSFSTASGPASTAAMAALPPI
jgi:hypothetical protein